jgi:Rha family phage regulatory protein
MQSPQDFNQLNFALISYTDTMNREQRAYELTKDGFSFLVMGYTGAKAAKFKVDFINEFNRRWEDK